MSDEHNPQVMGCAGHPIIRTPNIDALAARGTRFSSAYTTCPICVPARAAFAVGKYVHQIGYWDNGDAYDGAIPSWHHALRARGHEVVSIGKLHFRGAKGDDHGFTREIVPMHVVDAIGDVKGLVRDDIPKRKGGDKMAKYAGPGESAYTVYDREIAARAQVWLHEAAGRRHDRPWVLFVSFVAPHFPLTAPPEWYYEYASRDLPLPKQYARAGRPDHPVPARLRALRRLRHALQGTGGREARDRRLLRARELARREHREGPARARAERARRRHARGLHERPRRQRRRARALGQVDVLRGVGRRAADRRRRGRARRDGARRAGEPRRRLPVRVRERRRAACRATTRARESRSHGSPPASARTARC